VTGNTKRYWFKSFVANVKYKEKIKKENKKY